MRLAVLHPDYVYRPMTPSYRQKLSDAHRTRLGLPDGYCRIYGVHVLLDRAEPLRSYACDIARRHGYQAAHVFVTNAVLSNSPPERPFPELRRAYGPYLPPKEFARLRALRRLVRSFHLIVQIASGTSRKCYAKTANGPSKKVDWDLAEALLDEGATEADLVTLFSVSPTYIRHQAIKRGLRHVKRRFSRDR